jgi:hypothetical protein
MKQPAVPAPESILKLVDNFEEHRRAYLSQAYNERQARLLNKCEEGLGTFGVK